MDRIDAMRVFVTAVDEGSLEFGFCVDGPKRGLPVFVDASRKAGSLSTIHRTTRSISLTEDGEIMIEYARKFLRLADDAKQHFGAPSWQDAYD
jgi:hypothetical protein